MFTSNQWDVISFMMEESKRERGNTSALHLSYCGLKAYHILSFIRGRRLEIDDVRLLAHVISLKNGVFRQKDNRRSPILAKNVVKYLHMLLERQDQLTPEDFYASFRRIQPFPVGNHILGAMIYNWLGNNLDTPISPPQVKIRKREKEKTEPVVEVIEGKLLPMVLTDASQVQLTQSASSNQEIEKELIKLAYGPIQPEVVVV